VVNVFPPVDPILPLENETQVVNPISPSVDPIPPLRNVNVTDLVSSSVSPTLPLKSAKVVGPVFPSIDAIPPLKNVKVTDPIPSSVSPTLPPKSSKVVASVTSSVNPTFPLKSSKVFYPSPPLVDPIRLSIAPTLLIESKPYTIHVFIVNIDSTIPRGIPPSPAKPPPSNEAILFYWGVLARPHLPSHIPF
jgi:hypothetical protein